MSTYMQTCRFCKESDFSGTETMVKYGTRHYAHFQCYLDAGKSLNDLHEWQVKTFPDAIIKGGRMNLMDFLADACRAQAEQYRAEQIALGMRNLQQLTESVAVPVAHEVNPEAIRFSVEVVRP